MARSPIAAPSPALPRSRVWLNVLLMGLVALPAIIEYRLFLRLCPAHLASSPSHLPLSFSSSPTLQSAVLRVCHVCLHRPLLLMNVLLLLNMDVLLWLMSLLQNSTWLIDPHWQFIPLMLAHAYAHHPLAVYAQWRSWLSFSILYLWAARLLHSYFRRERWQVGWREDWRFTWMRSLISPRCGEVGWKLSTLLLVYVSQHPFLFAFTLPYYAIHTSTAPPSLWDALACALCGVGLLIGHLSDTSLHRFMLANEQRPVSARQPVLESGLWRYSRRPNYFGEAAFWTGVGCFAVACNRPWYLLGAAANAVLLWGVSFMVEHRMLQREDRREAYEAYMRRVSRMLPWFRSEERSQLKKAQ